MSFEQENFTLKLKLLETLFVLFFKQNFLTYSIIEYLNVRINLN